MNAVTLDLIEDLEAMEGSLETLLRRERARTGRRPMRAECAAPSDAMIPACFRWCQNRVYEVGKILHPEVAQRVNSGEVS